MVNIRGTKNNDTIDGTVNDDKLEGLSGSDQLNGFDGNDTLIGDDPINLRDSVPGNDILNGGVGNDTMRGGGGRDRYIVDSIGDRVFENLDEGTDTVETSISFTLGANLENLVLTGSNAINGTGNALNNSISGNDAANTISGGLGNDTLDGSGGDDVLNGGIGNDSISGGSGNDTLNGGTGTNRLNGGLGDDTYDISSPGTNTIVDTGGIDTVRSRTSFVLGANIENLTLQGFGTNGTGNTLNNVIIGNTLNNILNGGDGLDTLHGGGGNDALSGGSGNDTLDGGTGADRLDGGFGNDTYIVDNAGDFVREVFLNAISGQIDTIESSINIAVLAAGVENLTLVGSAISGTGNLNSNIITGNQLASILDGAAGNDSLIGGINDDLLIGGSGNDTLVGGAGNNTLDGGIGSDVYVFRNLSTSVIRDFGPGDKIGLGIQLGAIPTSTSTFTVANDAQAALSAERITYSSGTGKLFFNENGALAGFGSGGQFASITNAPTSLTSADFVSV